MRSLTVREIIAQPSCSGSAAVPRRRRCLGH